MQQSSENLWCKMCAWQLNVNHLSSTACYLTFDYLFALFCFYIISIPYYGEDFQRLQVASIEGVKKSQKRQLQVTKIALNKSMQINSRLPL